MDDEIQKEADRLMDIINEIAYDKSVPSLMVDCEVANILTENERRLKHQIEMLEGANDAWQKRSAELARIKQLEAELARIKPSWDDAPEWATSYFCTAFWYEGEKERHKYLCDFVEGRPESE